MKIYPVCARCFIVMNPNAFDDVAPGFLINGECYCPECAKDWLKDEVDSDPEAVARAIELSKSKYCSASIMLGKTAEITHDFEIVESPA